MKFKGAEKNMSYSQRTFGNSFPDGGLRNKTKVILTNPQGTVELQNFDTQPNRLKLMRSFFPEIISEASTYVLRPIDKAIATGAECPEDENFWEWWIKTRNTMRVTTLKHEFVVMLQYLQIAGYYSRTYLAVFLNHRLSQKDGVSKGDLILSENEIAWLLRKQYDCKEWESRARQKALDIFILALFTGARVADVRTIVRSIDEQGNPVLLYHNKKGTRTQSIAWNPAVEGPLNRGLYKTTMRSQILYAALKAALYEALPATSNRLISYYYIRPGKGRVLHTDHRLTHIGFHTARHTFCTRLLRIGISPAIVAQLAGHKCIQTTMKYYNWTKASEANDVLRDVYKEQGVAVSKPAGWGEGADVKKLPAYVHAKQLPQPQPAVMAPDDGGLGEKLKSLRPVNTRPPRVTPLTEKRRAMLEEIKRRGIE